SAVRDGFRRFFEGGFVGQSWLVGEGISDLGRYPRMELSCGEMVETQEWVLSTAALPVTTLERLCAMALELTRDQEQREAQTNAPPQTRVQVPAEPAAPAVALGRTPSYVVALGEVVHLSSPEMATT